MNSKLYVGNLSPAVLEAELLALFSRVGAVTEVIVALDPVTNQSRGFGFVTMATPELAAAALKELHCHSLADRHITVTEARPPQERTGLIREGFGFDASSPFRPALSRDKKPQRSTRSARPQRRGR